MFALEEMVHNMVFKRFIKGFSSIPTSLKIVFKMPHLFFYMIIPTLISIVSFALLCIYTFHFLNDIFADNISQMNQLNWLENFLNVFWIIGITLVLFFTTIYLFLTVTKIFAAPFNDLLSEKIEIEFNENYKKTENALSHFISTLFPTIWGEIKKVSFILSGFLIIYLISFFFAVLSPLLFIAYSILVVSIDFLDYPLARRQRSFKMKLFFLRTHLAEMLGFGTAVFVLLMIPIVGLFVIQLAIIAGTLLFIELDSI